MLLPAREISPPGSWCGFCKFRTQCRARAEHLSGAYKHYTEKEALTNAEVAEVLTLASEMESWLKDIKESALEQALTGSTFPGWKVVEGRSVRKIVDEPGLIAKLISEGYAENAVIKPVSIETITNLEKLLGKKQFGELAESYIEKPPGKPVLVPETDKRPEYSAVENDFDFI